MNSCILVVVEVLAKNSYNSYLHYVYIFIKMTISAIKYTIFNGLPVVLFCLLYWPESMYSLVLVIVAVVVAN